jgi:low affinity Fe/Cu permease
MGKAAQAFERFADHVSKHIGGIWAFSIAILIIIGYAWSQANVFNVLIDILTFLFVFIIQNNQNRSNKAIQIKLNEMILSSRQARNHLLDIENLPEEKLDRLVDRFKELAEKEREKTDPPPELADILTQEPQAHPPTDLRNE